MPPAAYEANAGMTILAAWGADVSGCGRVSCCFLFSPGPFFNGSVGDLLFNFLQLLMKEAAPAAVVCSNVFSAIGVHFQGFHISFAHVLVPQLWAATGSFANGKFSIGDVHCWAFCAETALGFRTDTFSKLLEAREHDMSILFAHNTQERDASEVVTVAPVPFVLIQGDDFGIFHVLRDAAFTPALAKGVV